jgi:hypothetical protein
MMNRLLDVLFGATLFPLLARLTYLLLWPVLRGLELPPASLAAVLRGIAAEAVQGQWEAPALGNYSSAEIRDIAKTLAALLRGVADAFGFTALTDARMAQLCGGVADLVV